MKVEVTVNYFDSWYFYMVENKTWQNTGADILRTLD